MDECEALLPGHQVHRGAGPHGGVVQVEPGLTPLAFRDFQRLKLKYDEPLSNLAFNFNWCPYHVVFRWERDPGFGEGRGLPCTSSLVLAQLEDLRP